MSIDAPKIDLRSAETVCSLLEQAGEMNLHGPLRSGSVIDLPDHGNLVVSGDLHDNRLHLKKLINLAELQLTPSNHLLVQEVVHGGKMINGLDLSYLALMDVAVLQLRYPGQVHMLLANHELAQINGDDISKGGISYVKTFNEGLDFVFGKDADDVRAMIKFYVRTFAMAVRCANGILCCHSLPSTARSRTFDPLILSRVPTADDLKGPSGAAYCMVWGRNFSQEWANSLAKRWGCRMFVLGHQPAEMGYELRGDTMMILNSDHEHGVALPIDLSHEYTRVELVENIIPLAGVRAD